MNWFLVALIPPFLDSICVYIDKYLLSSYFKGGGAGTLLLFSSLVGLLIFPLILVFHPTVLNVQINNALLLTINGIIGALLLLPYFYALNHDDASIVIPLLQLTTAFSFIFGYIFLGEKLASSQILGSVMIILGAFIISLDFSKKLPRLKKPVFWSVALVSFLYALNSLIFKFIAIKENFWTSLFWEYLGLSVLGILLYAFVSTYRNQFHQVLKINKGRILGVNLVNELVYVCYVMTLRYATLLAPLALVWVVNGFQPYFAFIIGIVITLCFPKLGKENLSKGIIFQKLVALYVMFVGLFILNS